MLRLGLDLGTNSIGWALFKCDEDHTPIELVDGGVLIHPDGRNPKDRASNAAKRREKRGPRRNRDRMLRRRRSLAHLLDGLSLLAQSEQEKSIERDKDPLKLRAKALDEALSPFELGRVFMAFVDRRGFKSNRKTDGGEGGKLRAEIDILEQRIQQSGARTLGEYLWRRRSKGKTIRARLGNGLYPQRSMIEAELDQIIKAQKSYHSHLIDEDWNTIRETLTFQRPLRSVERGWCSVIPGEKRAYKAYPVFQNFRILSEVLNLEVGIPGGASRSLDAEEIFKIVSALRQNKTRSFEQLAALLNLPDGSRFNLQTEARSGLDGDQTATILGAKKRFGKQLWASFSLEQQQDIVERLLESEDHDELVGWLKSEFNVDGEAAIAIAEANLPAGTAAFSKVALQRLVPVMQDQGLRYHDALPEAGLGHHSQKTREKHFERLPYYGEALPTSVVGARPDGRSEPERFGRVSNPTVHIALGQMRRLFNAICDHYGKPDQIVVEMARDLKQSEQDRKRDLAENKKNQDRNERLRKVAMEAQGGAEPTTHQMRKLRIWDEQGPLGARVCPFSNTPLSVERVLSDATEIEHILPFSKSLDDSMNNLVLATREANREKGNNSPFEKWGGDAERYANIVARAQSLPYGKRWRFEPDAMTKLESRQDFLSRQLNDTRYLSRMTKEYLGTVLPENKIWVTPGRMTAMLRRSWGLNSLLSDSNRKERTDHRHHLIDAITVGLTSRGLLQGISRLSGKAVDELGGRLSDAIDDPWPSFRDDVRGLLDRCIVRHRTKVFNPAPGGTSGSLHNDTAYGVISGPDPKGMMTLVETKPLEGISRDGLSNVRDLALRDRLLSLWDNVHLDQDTDKQKQQEFCARAWTELRVRKVRVILRLAQASLAFMKDRSSGGLYKAYKTDGNAFMDVWLLPNGKTRGETVSRFNAHQPGFQSEIKSQFPTARKLMRLQVNDMIAIGEGVDRNIMRVQRLSGQEITAVHHNEGGNLRERERTKNKSLSYKSLRKSASQVIGEKIRKISVDYIGRVRDGGPIKVP